MANPKTSLKQIAEEFSNFNVLLKKSSIHSILKNKQNIIAAINNGIKIKRSHLTKGRHANFDDALLNWIRQVRAENVVITGTLLKVFLFLKFFWNFSLRKKQWKWLI